MSVEPVFRDYSVLSHPTNPILRDSPRGVHNYFQKSSNRTLANDHSDLRAIRAIAVSPKPLDSFYTRIESSKRIPGPISLAARRSETRPTDICQLNIRQAGEPATHRVLDA
jgi:hypothetical protein